MIRIENIESLFLQLGSKLREMWNKLETNLKNWPGFHLLLQSKEFMQNHPLISLFLVICTILGSFPFIVFVAFVSSSFILVLLSAITVFGGTFAVAFICLLVFLFPIMTFGVGVAVFLYFAYCLVATVLQIVKILLSIVQSSGFKRKLRRHVSELRSSTLMHDSL